MWIFAVCIFVYVYFQDVNKDNVTMKVETYVGTFFTYTTTTKP